MCMQTSAVRSYQGWRWFGDEIFHSTIIPAKRKVPGTNITRYDIDIREFLSTESNSVVSKHVQKVVEGMSAENCVRFLSREKGSFDFRAMKIAEYVGGFEYQPRGRVAKEWLFPVETLANKGGDCEDLAFLLAAMLESSGISPYCIRVALGVLVDHNRKGSKKNRHDHVWVMYFNENGVWQILEPLALPNEEKWRAQMSARHTPAMQSVPEDIEYLPHYVFNRHHLWNVRTWLSPQQEELEEYLDQRKQFWKEFDPTFAAGAHNDIFNEALEGMPWFDLLRVKAASLAVDANVLRYTPIDHFDMAYVDQAWAKVDERLATGKLNDFALAVHSISDFYAHTMYGEFARWVDDETIKPLINRMNPDYAKPLQYDFKPLIPADECPLEKDLDQAAERWKGQLISGKWLRPYVHFPSELEANKADYDRRLCLPDHDAVAVDGPTLKPKHKLYKTQDALEKQYKARRKAAIEHIKSVYSFWKPIP